VFRDWCGGGEGRSRPAAPAAAAPGDGALDPCLKRGEGVGSGHTQTIVGFERKAFHDASQKVGKRDSSAGIVRKILLDSQTFYCEISEISLLQFRETRGKRRNNPKQSRLSSRF
jgi:hypothetical protein